MAEDDYIPPLCPHCGQEIRDWEPDEGSCLAPQQLYAMGIKHGPKEYGMVAGPTPDLNELLHCYGQKWTYIIDLITFKPIYKWDNIFKNWERLP